MLALRKIVLAGGAILSVAVALASLRYVMPSWPVAPEIVAANPFARPWLSIHATCAALALLLGPFQFLVTRGGQRRRWHRLSGRIYVLGCLIAGGSGFILALGATTGPISTAGFGTLAIVWVAINILGLKAALERRFDAHRRWMIRSFALTFGAVTLRLYLPIGPALGFSFEDAYRLLSFASWAPNLILAELYLASRRQVSVATRPISP